MLWTLPYECRGLYFKYVEVRKNTHDLVHGFASYMADVHKIDIVA